MATTVILDHPLIQHNISLLRDERTGTRDFRILVSEIAMLMGYEAMRDQPTELVEVKTPITTAQVPMLSGKKLAIVPILRAGLGMVDGILNLVPSAKVGHIGLYRDEVTFLQAAQGDRRPPCDSAGPDACDRRLRNSGSAVHQGQGLQSYQIHVHYRGTGRSESLAAGASGY